MKHLLLTTIAAVVSPIIALSGPIHDAAMKGDLNGVQAELDKGIDVDQLLGEGFVRDPLEPFMPIALEGSPLQYAVVGGHKEVAELLIAKGADVNLWFSGSPLNTATPLHQAADGGYMEIAELLIANGADVNAIIESGLFNTIKGWTPLDFAKGETADTIRRHGGKSGAEYSIHVAVRLGNIEAVEKHLVAGADVNANGRWREGTPLRYAVRIGHKEIVELLIANGADVNAKKDDGVTPLHYAAEEGHKEIAELLIAKGADVNAKVESGPKQGLTPLDAANETNHTETAALLRKHGGKTGEELKAEAK